MKQTMFIPIIGLMLIVIGIIMLILGTVPTKNELKDDTLIVHFIIGRKTIDMKGAQLMPVPDEATHNIIRIFGASIGKKHSGHFMNYKTKTKYLFYLTGEGEKVFFKNNNKNYLIDGLSTKTAD